MFRDVSTEQGPNLGTAKILNKCRPVLPLYETNVNIDGGRAKEQWKERKRMNKLKLIKGDNFYLTSPFC